MPDTRALNLYYRVTNPDAADYGRVGMAVDVLDESDLQQRTTWLILELDGVPVAFHKDELARVDGEARHV